MLVDPRPLQSRTDRVTGEIFAARGRHSVWLAEGLIDTVRGETRPRWPVLRAEGWLRLLGMRDQDRSR